MIQTIKNDRLVLKVEEFGAQLQSICSNEGVEYLWQGNPEYWSDRAINLFPYCARLTDGSYYLDGKLYKMNIHGLAMYNSFETANKKDDSITLRFMSNEETRKSFPRDFVYDICYVLDKNSVKVTFEVTNKDEKDMYFGLGGHPGFNVPLINGLTFEDYYIEFEGLEKLTKLNFTPDCFPDGTTSDFKLENGKYHLHHDMFDEDAIIVTDTAHKVTLKSDKDIHSVCVEFPDLDYLGIWHMPRTDAPYICLEPWSSLPSRKGVVEHFEKQDNLIRLRSGEKYQTTWSIEIK